MPFMPLYNLFPDVAERETRIMTVPPGTDIPLPPGEYSFIEMFCDEMGCDCRRAFFTVFAMPAEKTEAIISWGWETAAFYKRWASFADPNMIEQLQGPILDLGSPISANARFLLDFFANVILADPLYVERVKKHYALFRGAIDSGRAPDADGDADSGGSRAGASDRSDRNWGNFTRNQQASEAGARVGRNDPCPCGSGKKFKHCCLRSDQ